MNLQLRVLDAISSIMELAVVEIDYIGEAKSEIHTLRGNLESNENFAIKGRHMVAEELLQIVNIYRGFPDERLEGSRNLAVLSRQLWTQYSECSLSFN
jgi:hypothetical protein